MAGTRIRNLDEGLTRRVRIRAAEHGRSMEKARDIPRQAIAGPAAPGDQERDA